MATLSTFLSKPPSKIASFPLKSAELSSTSSISFPSHARHRLLLSLSLRATAAPSAATSSEERVKQVHSIDEFDGALRSAKNKLVVVEYAASHSRHSRRIYPFMVELSRTCADVVFLLVMGDESDDTKELCRRERIEKVPHFSFYKTMEKIHTKKRNRLEHKRLNALVYVRYNTRLRERSIKRKHDFDPILVDDMDSDDEWLVEKEDPLLPEEASWMDEEENVFDVGVIRSVTNPNEDEVEAETEHPPIPQAKKDIFMTYSQRKRKLPSTNDKGKQIMDERQEIEADDDFIAMENEEPADDMGRFIEAEEEDFDDDFAD